jgi:hypothetical protein
MLGTADQQKTSAEQGNAKDIQMTKTRGILQCKDCKTETAVSSFEPTK